MKNFTKPAVLAFIFALLFAAGCKKNSVDTSLLVLNIYPYFGNDSIVAGKNYATATGDSVSFSRTSFYITNLTLTSTSGTTYADSGYLLVTADNRLNLIAGTVPTGSYKSISFNVGVNLSDNHTDPSGHSGGPLVTQSPAMHFSSDNLGYIFMAVEGLADSTNNHQSPNKTFSYHLGSDSLLETVNLPDHSAAPYSAAFNATGGKVMTVNVIADFSQLLQRVNIPANPVTNTSDVPVLADTLAAHVGGMFRYLN